MNVSPINNVPAKSTSFKGVKMSQEAIEWIGKKYTSFEAIERVKAAAIKKGKDPAKALEKLGLEFKSLTEFIQDMCINNYVGTKGVDADVLIRPGLVKRKEFLVFGKPVKKAALVGDVFQIGTNFTTPMMRDGKQLRICTLATKKNDITNWKRMNTSIVDFIEKEKANIENSIRKSLLGIATETETSISKANAAVSTEVQGRIVVERGNSAIRGFEELNNL